MKLENRFYSIDAICGAHIVGLMWAYLIVFLDKYDCLYTRKTTDNESNA